MRVRGAAGWGCIAAFTVAFDVLAEQTLSDAYKNAREHENSLIRAATIGGLAVTAFHLLDVIPEKVDPFDRSISTLRHCLGRVAGVPSLPHELG